MKKLILELSENPDIFVENHDIENRKLRIDGKRIEEILIRLPNKPEIINIQMDNPDPNNQSVLRFELGITLLCSWIEQEKLKLNVKKVILSNIYFNGPRCVNALLKLCKYINIQCIQITDETNNQERKKNNYYPYEVAITLSDRERLATLINKTGQKTTIILPNNSVLIPSFRDDTSLKTYSWNKSPHILQKLTPKTHFFAKINYNFFPSRDILKHFFSVFFQQRLDYTCAAAVFRGIWNYYSILEKRGFNAHPIDPIFKKKWSEETLSLLMKTTWQNGTNLVDMTESLEKWNLNYWVNTKSLSEETERYKLIKNFKLLINAGIPNYCKLLFTPGR